MSKTCSRPGCGSPAVARLSYAYALSQVEVRPIEAEEEPSTYTLCATHVDRLKVPKGWRLLEPGQTSSELPADEIEALARRVRQVGGLGDDDSGDAPRGTEHSLSRRANIVTLASRAHLRVVADASQYAARRPTSR
ncbi:MAG: DUF3499 domain-containing protein [Propionibacteriaceae bacterium]|nr:DUF3499 domain-containing protein [Propionibacteriaceae bacterium]